MERRQRPVFRHSRLASDWRASDDIAYRISTLLV
jgi:hypothetical protein